MKDKINRLARGIIDSEFPEIIISPDSFDGHFSIGSGADFILEVMSKNGISVKGICYTDEPRISSVVKGFNSRRTHIDFKIDTEGLKAGDALKGQICVVTNHGEFFVPYRFVFDEVEEGAQISLFDKGIMDEGNEKETAETAETSNGRSMEEFPLPSGLFYDPEGEAPEKNSYGEMSVKTQIPDGDSELSKMTGRLIRDDNTDGFAFEVYKEGIKRGLSITNLYEYYVRSFPSGLKEKMPEEVLLYFSMDPDPDEEIKDRLYNNVLRFVEKNTELYNTYEPRIRDHAVKSALSGRINSDLCLIYDRMLYPGMIDRKASAFIPDIIMAHRIRVKEPAAYVCVKYRELKTGVFSEFKGNTAYIPVYTEDAEFVFFDAEQNEIKISDYEDRALFNKPEIIKACFNAYGEHRMLLLRTVRKISVQITNTETEKDICLLALSLLDFEDSYRESIISLVGKIDSGSAWVDELSEEDLEKSSKKDIFAAYLRTSRYKEAYMLLRDNGLGITDGTSVLKLFTMLIGSEKKPVVSGETDTFFVKSCKKLFDEDIYNADILEELALDYEGGCEDMCRILSKAFSKAELHELPEKALSLCLYTENTSHIDDVFEIYIETTEYSDIFVRAYLTKRSHDYFLLKEKNVKKIFFDVLESYIRAAKDQEALPELWLLSLTKHYSEKDRLNELQTELCRKLTGFLIENGLVFQYTKKLRKKIKIPADICERYFIEYYGTKDSLPQIEMQLKTVSGTESDKQKKLQRIYMERVYKNIFVSKIMLFAGEELKFTVFDNGEAADEGVIRVTKLHSYEDDRFSELNLMTRAHMEKDSETLFDSMYSYVSKTGLYRELFDIENGEL